MKSYGFIKLAGVVAIAGAVAVVQAAPPKTASILIAEGDALGGSTVSTLNAPFTDGNGKVGFVGALADSQRFVWWDTGPVFYSGSAAPDALTGGEGTMGVGNGGEFVYSPSFNGNDAVYGNNGLILKKGDPAPDLPAGWNNTFNSRPQMTNDGTAYWIGGFDDTGGTSTKGRVLYKQAQGGTPLSVVRSDDLVGGLTVTRSSGVDFDYHVSGGGSHLINIFDLDTGSTSNDIHVAVDLAPVAQEGMPTGQGDNWANFDNVSINDSGRYLFSGDTDGVTSSDEFIAANGSIALREGDMVDGRTLGSSVNALSLNNLDQAVFIWTTDLSESLFFGDLGDLTNATALLSVGDEIDVDGNLVADYSITDFNASGITGPGLDLAENGQLFVEVDLLPIAGGDEIEAIIRLVVPEPASLMLLAFGGLALLRRR